MSEKQTRQMTIRISGRPYPLKVKPGEEQLVNDVVNEINEKVLDYQNTYTSKDKQDCLSMALMTYAFELKEAQNSLVDPALITKIDSVEEFIDSLLKD